MRLYHGNDTSGNARVFKRSAMKAMRYWKNSEGEKNALACFWSKWTLGSRGLGEYMKILCDSGIVSNGQEGKWTHYRLSESGRDYAAKLLERADHRTQAQKQTPAATANRASAQRVTFSTEQIKIFRYNFYSWRRRYCGGMGLYTKIKYSVCNG